MAQKSSRRDFIRRSATAIAGVVVLPEIIPSSALGMGGSVPPSDRIVMGCIGTGSQGMSNMHDFLRLGVHSSGQSSQASSGRLVV